MLTDMKNSSLIALLTTGKLAVVSDTLFNGVEKLQEKTDGSKELTWIKMKQLTLIGMAAVFHRVCFFFSFSTLPVVAFPTGFDTPMHRFFFLIPTPSFFSSLLCHILFFSGGLGRV